MTQNSDITKIELSGLGDPLWWLDGLNSKPFTKDHFIVNNIEYVVTYTKKNQWSVTKLFDDGYPDVEYIVIANKGVKCDCHAGLKDILCRHKKMVILSNKDLGEKIKEIMKMIKMTNDKSVKHALMQNAKNMLKRMQNAIC